MTITHSPVVEVIDIRRDKPDASLAQQILNGLADENPANRSLPTMILYDGTVCPMPLYVIAHTSS
jgi:hypothetical protein